MSQTAAFETELSERMGKEKVYVDEVYLDHARFPEKDMEEALVDYLEKRIARWQPDLVVPLVSPACVFVAQHREQLFPQTPILYAGMDKRRLPAGALQKNATFVGNHLDLPGFAEDILQVAPDTTNIVCVIGASPVERYWTAEFQSEFARFTNRVTFTWLNDLSFDQMLERVKRLPPRSFVFVILLLRDAAGVAHDSEDVLKQVCEEANAPVNSIFENELGLGIVGGRLYSARAEGVEAGRIAARILQGESAASLAPVILGPVGSRYDWRELSRWNISEKRLPPGSVVRYRQPTMWDRHRLLIISGFSLVVVQAALITGLVLNLRSRRRAECSLRYSEERMKLAAGAAKLGMWEWDFASNKIWVDTRSRGRLETASEEASDYARFMRTVHPEDRDGVAQAVAKAISGDGHYEQVHRQLLSDGQIRWIAARARVEFNTEHKPIKMRGVGMDITARKLAEDRARESETQFLLIANSSPVLMWTSDPRLQCTFCNQAWLDFRGRTLDQELGDGWADGLHPEDRPRCLETVREAYEVRQPFTIEYRVLRHDGQYRWISDHGVPRYDGEKKFLGYIGSCVDVTERKETEQEAQRTKEELAHVSRISVLGELAGSLAHELKQPLTAIVSSGDAVQELMNEGVKNEQEMREALKDIVEQGQRASEIIGGIRAMLKKDAGQMVPQDLNLAIRKVLEIVKTDLMIRGVTATLRLDPHLPPVKGHAVQLQQVVLNLIINACDAMAGMPPGAARLTIESRRAAAGEVEVSITDSGAGFSDEMFRHMFEPFHTTKPKGLGLGLPICRSIIGMHGGRLAAANNGGKGAILKFTLPAQKELYHD